MKTLASFTVALALAAIPVSGLAYSGSWYTKPNRVCTSHTAWYQVKPHCTIATPQEPTRAWFIR